MIAKISLVVELSVRRQLDKLSIPLFNGDSAVCNVAGWALSFLLENMRAAGQHKPQRSRQAEKSKADI